jgi:hypothetical protein
VDDLTGLIDFVGLELSELAAVYRQRPTQP